MAQFELYKDVKKEYRLRFRADNNEIIADSSEGYINKSDCKHGIEPVKEQAPDAKIVDKT